MNQRSQWSVIVRMKGSEAWYTTGVKYDSFREAESYAHNQYLNHEEVTEWHIVPAKDDGQQVR